MSVRTKARKAGRKAAQSKPGKFVLATGMSVCYPFACAAWVVRTAVKGS